MTEKKRSKKWTWKKHNRRIGKYYMDHCERQWNCMIWYQNGKKRTRARMRQIICVRKNRQRERENINYVLSGKHKRTERLEDKNQRKLRKKEERIEREKEKEVERGWITRKASCSVIDPGHCILWTTLEVERRKNFLLETKQKLFVSFSSSSCVCFCRNLLRKHWLEIVSLLFSGNSEIKWDHSAEFCLPFF